MNHDDIVSASTWALNFNGNSSKIWNLPDIDFRTRKSVWNFYLDTKYAKKSVEQIFTLTNIRLTKINDGKHELTMDIPSPNQNKRVYELGINFYKEYICDWTTNGLGLFKLS